MNSADKPMITQGWLRALLYILLSLALVVSVSFAVALLFPQVFAAPAANDAGSPAAMLSYYSINAAIFIGLAVLLNKFADRRPLMALGFEWRRFRNDAAAGFFLGILLMVTGSLVLVMLQYLYFTGITVSTTSLLTSVLLFVLVAFTEEIAFRGYILGNLLQSMNKWLALVITAILFSLFHISNDNIGLIPLLNIFIAGLLLGINFIFTRNLWFAIALHFSWNFFQGPILGYEVSGTSTGQLLTQQLAGPDLFTGGDFGFEGSIICLVLNTLATVLLAAYYSGFRSPYKKP